MSTQSVATVDIEEVNRLAEERRRASARHAIRERLRVLTERSRSSEPCERWLPFRSMAIIVGATKAGTATLYHHLRRHPQIAENMQSPRPDFFSRPRHIPATDRFQNGWPWYLAQWDFDPQHHRHALEASTSYTEFPAYDASFGRMKTMPIDYKLIYILRDPIDRLESQFRDSFALWRTPPDRDRLLGDGPIGASCYALQIDRIIAHFPREDLLLLPYTALVEHPAGVVRTVHRFLGLDDHDDVEISLTPNADSDPDVEWSLTDEERRLIHGEIEGDLTRLNNVYGFPVEDAFPTVARIAGRAGV